MNHNPNETEIIMGVYVYTLRTETKPLVDGEIVGRAAYSYKQNYAFQPSPQYRRSVAAKHSHAERASTKLVGKVKYMVYGDKFESGLDVFYTGDRLPVVFEDTEWPGKKVGKLVKIGRKWLIEKD